MRIDSHQHFWRYDPTQYAWITDNMAVLRRDFLPEDLQPLLRATGFDGSIAVQARQSVEETEWLLALAEQHSSIKGVVGWVALRSPDVAQQLKRFGSHPKLVGVRHVVQDEPDDRFMLRDDFRRGIAQLQAFDLRYDLLVFPKQLPAAICLVAEFPEQHFVLDHIGKPPIRDHQITPWREQLRELGRYPNVFCKLSGMVTEANWTNWQEEQIRPYLDVVIESFGPDRLMIGSDWPVCTLAGEYERVIRMVSEYLGRFGASSLPAILGDNCARFYGV